TCHPQRDAGRGILRVHDCVVDVHVDGGESATHLTNPDIASPDHIDTVELEPPSRPVLDGASQNGASRSAVLQLDVRATYDQRLAIVTRTSFNGEKAGPLSGGERFVE